MSSVAEKGLRNQFAREGPSRAKYTRVVGLLCISSTTAAKLLRLFYYETSCQESVGLGACRMEDRMEDRGVRVDGNAFDYGLWAKSIVR